MGFLVGQRTLWRRRDAARSHHGIHPQWARRVKERDTIEVPRLGGNCGYAPISPACPATVGSRPQGRFSRTLTPLRPVL